MVDADYVDGWLYAAAMCIWYEVAHDNSPREVVRVMREELKLAGGNPDIRVDEVEVRG